MDIWCKAENFIATSLTSKFKVLFEHMYFLLPFNRKKYHKKMIHKHNELVSRYF